MMGLYKNFVNQTRKPEGFLGKMMVSGMNGGHAKLADWGMDHLDGIDASSIVELGCGGGRNTAELLKRYPHGKVSALDYSPLSVEKTKEYNKDMIASGRCTVIQGNVAELPFDDESFELATAFETVYFWPGLEHCFCTYFGCFRLFVWLIDENYFCKKICLKPSGRIERRFELMYNTKV